jgi:hypothetical protein
MPLCLCCAEYLTKKTKANGDKDLVWPSMMWKWMSSSCLLQQHGSTIWSFVPVTMQPWWLEEVKRSPSVFGQVTLSYPQCKVVDVTAPKKKLEHSIYKRMELTDLKETVDELLYPLVKCFWG